jgi:hypothetical protein
MTKARRRRRAEPRIADPAKHIFAKRPRCRACNSPDLRATRTICRDGDAVHRYVTCKKCGQRYVLVLD